MGLYGASVRILMAYYANECTHLFARLFSHLALAIAVGRASNFLAFSLCEKFFLHFSQFSPFFLTFSLCKKILLRFSHFLSM